MQPGHELIYEYLSQCIHFQYYNYGELLPSVESLCAKFMASEQTIKTALRRMCTEGYLSVQKGRRARVIYRQNETQRDEYITRFLSERWPDYAELLQVSEIIFRTVLMEGFKHMDEDGYTALSSIAAQGDLDSLILFYCYVLQALKNPLIINLFWEIALFLGLPFMKKFTTINYNAHVVTQCLQQFIYMGKMQQWEILDAKLLIFWRNTTGSIVNSIEPYILPIPVEERITFVWRIYRGRPQICYTLAIHIMHEIFQGNFQENQHLPSYEKMAKIYGVSTNTIRQTVRLLKQIGVARPVNGKRTRVFSFGQQYDKPDLTVSALRRNLVLLNRSFELLLYSCESAAYVILSNLSYVERLKLVGQLKEYIHNGNCGFTPWLLLLTFAKQAPMRSLREIYSKIYGLSLWGYPLKASGEEFPSFENTVYTLTTSMIEHLEKNQMDQCAAAFKEYSVKEYPATRKYLIGLGIEVEDLN